MAKTPIKPGGIAGMLPPVAQKRPVPLTLHGETRFDDYYWMRYRGDPAVIEYLESENTYTRAVMEPFKAFADKLFEEMRSRVQEADMSVPYRLDGYYYYSRFDEGAQYPVLCRKSVMADGSWEQAPEKVLLDINRLAKGKRYMSIGEFDVSPDGRWLAYSTDSTGFRQYRLQIKDLGSGKLLPWHCDRVTSVAWALDGKTFFYTTEHESTKRSNQLWRHTLGNSEDRLIHEERDEHFAMDVYLTRSRGFIVQQIGSHTSSEIRYLAADRPFGRWRVLKRRRANIEYSIDHHGDQFYLRINDAGRNFRLVRMPVTDTSPARWEEVLPQREDVALEAIDLFERFMVREERRDGLGQLVITELASQQSHTVVFDEPVYSLGSAANAEWASRVYRYSYESLTTPETVYDYDMEVRTQVMRKRHPVLGDFDPARYVSERTWAAASDGVQVPISLVYRKDAVLNGSAPLWLDAYGAYGIPNDVYFSSARLSLLDRGIIVGIAHVRGGGDLGQRWHDAGKMADKHNTFGDLIACAEHLIERRYTAPECLIIEGGSAGGLLVTGAANMRPDLFGVVIADVPFVDVLTTMLDPSLPLTIGEYEEWGNPQRRQQYRWIRAYSPYDNIRPQNYPAMLVKTSLHDSQVMYWEPAKYVAKLRATKTGDRALLLWTNMGAGHGGASGRFERIREAAFDHAFVLSRLGITL